MCYITKITPIHFINGKCHIKQLKSRESHKTCLTNHTQPNHTTSCHWLLISSGQAQRQTDRQTDTRKQTYTHTHATYQLMHKPKQFQETQHVLGLNITDKLK